MRKVIFVLLALVLALVIACGALAQNSTCTGQLDFSGIPPGVSFTERPWGITFTNCPTIDATTFTEGSTGTLTIGGVQYTALIKFFVPANAGNPNPQVVFTLQFDQGATDPVSIFYSSTAAQFQYAVKGTLTTWPLAMTEALNQKSNSIHIGRADANQANQPSIPPAYELKVTSLYSHQPGFTGTREPITWDNLQDRKSVV